MKIREYVGRTNVYTLFIAHLL